ncbi:MAG: hypothetical protein H7Y32_19175, partial [Chloroflexales bacterium]|nr:hypothetical protein [Chloroflexales bacterium]
MRKKFLARFASIRWRLTLTYVLVSALFALTLLAIAVLAIVWLLNSNLLLNSIAYDANELARAVQSEFEAEPRNVDSLAAQLRLLSSGAPQESAEMGRASLQIQSDI